MLSKKLLTSVIKTVNKSETMCYKTAEKVLVAVASKANVKKIQQKNIESVNKACFYHLYKCSPSITTLEINLSRGGSANYNDVREKYNIKNRFWVPRIFNHSFNILITEKKVIISQSWFKTMSYKIIYDFSHAKFIAWLDKFRMYVKNFTKNPVLLFKHLKYTKFGADMKNMIKYAKDTSDMKIKILIKYACAKSC